MQSALATRWRRYVAALALVAALIAGAAGLTNAQSSGTPAATPAAAVREVLIQASPADAGGQVLQLVRYGIPAGIVLPEHTHPGVQEAYIEAGVLTYHVISGGSISVTRADGATEELNPGDSTELHPGDTVVEVPGVVHYGENLGTESVVILASTLLDPDQPASVLYTPEALAGRHPGGLTGNVLNLAPSQIAQAATVVAAWLECSPDDLTIEPAAGGRSTPTYRIQRDVRTYYLRLSETPTASLGPEALAHDVLQSGGVRVPAVIGYEFFDPVLDRSLMLTTAIRGASLDDAPPSNPASILTATGTDLARINQTPVDGFGWIRRDDPRPSQLKAAFLTWHEFAADLTSQPLDPWFDPPTIARITELSSIAPANLDRAHLAHGDFDPTHIFSLDGHYTGIIDLGEIRGAEPTFDLGHLALHAPDALPAILQGYATITPLSTDLPLQVTASALRIGWFRLTQSSARTNRAYAGALIAVMRHLAEESP